MTLQLELRETNFYRRNQIPGATGAIGKFDEGLSEGVLDGKEEDDRSEKNLEGGEFLLEDEEENRFENGNDDESETYDGEVVFFDDWSRDGMPAPPQEEDFALTEFAEPEDTLHATFLGEPSFKNATAIIILDEDPAEVDLS